MRSTEPYVPARKSSVMRRASGRIVRERRAVAEAVERGRDGHARAAHRGGALAATVTTVRSPGATR